MIIEMMFIFFIILQFLFGVVGVQRKTQTNTHEWIIVASIVCSLSFIRAIETYNVDERRGQAKKKTQK